MTTILTTKTILYSYNKKNPSYNNNDIVTITKLVTTTILVTTAIIVTVALIIIIEILTNNITEKQLLFFHLIL